MSSEARERLLQYVNFNDAANEGVTPDQLVNDAISEALKAAKDRVRALHTPVQVHGQQWCSECSVQRSTGRRTSEWVVFIPHPCNTLYALGQEDDR